MKTTRDVGRSEAATKLIDRLDTECGILSRSKQSRAVFDLYRSRDFGLERVHDSPAHSLKTRQESSERFSGSIHSALDLC